MNRRRTRGVTLIEIMVAVAIFSVMAMLAWGALSQSLENADMLTERMQRLQAIQRTFRYLSADLTQAAPRPVRNELGDGFNPAIFSSLGGDFAIELSHGGWGNPVGLPRSTLQRSAYRIENDELVRYHWNVLDRTYGNEPVAAVLLEDVEGLLFRFFDDIGEIYEVWPPQYAGGGGGGGGNMRVRPRAVEIILSLPDEGEITRLLEIAP
ncbi:MAG: type II secretion system minor pseudopilin GspJ [Proteobacteria bacterium]|nr:type II secretion system minor pseudopilin GspJ [Pseudomonadota bacterium]